MGTGISQMPNSGPRPRNVALYESPVTRSKLLGRRFAVATKCFAEPSTAMIEVFGK